MQDTSKILPLTLNLDSAFNKLSPTQTFFKRGLENSFNANGGGDIGTANPSGEGSNTEVLTPMRSNVAIPDALLPDGFNMNCGAGLSPVTQNTFVFNWNENGNHGIYMLSGNTAKWFKIIVDPKLKFSNDPKAYIAEHRINLRLVYDETGAVTEQYLFWTDGQVWQGFISVNAAIQTNGFDTSLYPYWSLQPPHFDREELFQWATRPIMFNPIVTKIPNTQADAGTINRILDKAIQFCVDITYTDGRRTTISPFSLPAITKTTDFLSNSDLIPKKYLIKLYAGSCMVESMNIYFRMSVSGKNQTDSDLQTWTDWYLYDTIYKYSSCGDNSSNVIGTKYWLRKNQWASYNYNATFNTIEYIFDNSKTAQIIDQSRFDRIQTALPQLSVGCTNVGDAALLGNNRYYYDNFGCDVTDKLGISIGQGSVSGCSVLTRKIKLYVYAARERGNASASTSVPLRNIFLSQVGYYEGADTTVRFGGMAFQTQLLSQPSPNYLSIDLDESKYFELDFAGKESFKVYLKGTPYSAEAKWYTVNQDFSMQPINGLLDATNTSDKTFIVNTYQNLQFFIGVFELEVPAGKYIATLGRHNVANNADYRGQSTYTVGIANSRLASNQTIPPQFPTPGNAITVKTVPITAIVSNSKEIEIDCTGADVDVWGNGADLFYVLVPFFGTFSQGGSDHVNSWSWVEGYLYEQKSANTPANPIIPIERFSYTIPDQIGYGGVYTDKNGFFFGYTWRVDNDPANANILFTNRINCQYPINFTVVNNNQNVAAWKPNNIAYLTDYNGGQVGVGNRVIYNGKITDPTGTIGYANIGISIKDGETVYTDQDGNFSMIIHNGFLQPISANVYVNAGGDFVMTAPDCGIIPILYYGENIVPCQTISARVYPTQSVKVMISSGEAMSLKQGASYTVTIIGADKAGRLTFANKISTIGVPTFLQRDNTNPTFFKWNLSGGALGLPSDIAYLTFGISLPVRKYIQWVGDKIAFIDINGNETTDVNNAALVRINIDSLLNANIQNNFTLLSTYQFVKNDRLQIYDDGSGVLFDTATYGSPIDVEVQGTNYNQAAVNANLVIPPINTVLPSQQTAGTNPTSIFVNYDSRFNKLQDKTGFWIEIYTPLQNNDKLPVRESTWSAVIKGEIATYTGGGVSNPQYNYPTTGQVDYWDTYLIRRTINIPDVGSQFIDHPFESPNVIDSWGANLDSGGRPNEINPEAAQIWLKDNTIRSDDFVNNGILNGLGTWREENKKSYKGFGRGGIVGIICSYSVILFICENDWFTADYNIIYAKVNVDGSLVTANLDRNLGEPAQKVGSAYGCALEDTKTIIMIDKEVWWHDRNNEAWVLCDYVSAKDVSEIKGKEGNNIGVKSYIMAKTKFLTQWNSTHDLKSIFDISCGIDEERNMIYVTYRPRRQNSTNLNTFITNRRNLDIAFQETFVFNLDTGEWRGLANFCPEAYTKAMGNNTGLQLISFASGKPYMHNTGKGFLNYYGLQTEPVFIAVFNKNEMINIFQSLMLDILNNVFYVDMVYDNEQNSFSYIPYNYFITKEKKTYAAFLREMVTYFAPDSGTYQSTLISGKRIFGRYCVVRFVGKKEGKYFQLNEVDYLTTASVSNKP